MRTPSTGWVTVTRICPRRLDPSVAVAVMTAEPRVRPETRPLASTVATFRLLELKVTSLMVASAGYTCQTSCACVCTGRDTGSSKVI